MYDGSDSSLRMLVVLVLAKVVVFLVSHCERQSAVFISVLSVCALRASRKAGEGADARATVACAYLSAYLGLRLS